MHYLYVLTSSTNDFYYEQFLLSITSLKLKMPDAETTLLCDSKTAETLTGKRTEYEKLISNIVSAEPPYLMSQIEVSRWLKTSMRRLVKGDFLFIDCDTIVTDNLSSIKELGIEFGACLDRHSLINFHDKKNFIIKNDNRLGFSSYLLNKHYNSGVIFCADTPAIHNFFERWHDYWLFSKKNNILRDQPAFNMAISENHSLVAELDGTWNCQVAFNGLQFLEKSKIIHCFISDTFLAASPFMLSSEDLLKNIKKSGRITDDAFELLKNPRSAFSPQSRILSGSEMIYVINSDFFQFIIFLKKKIPFLFRFFNFLCSLFKRVIKSKFIKSSRKKGAVIYN